MAVNIHEAKDLYIALQEIGDLRPRELSWGSESSKNGEFKHWFNTLLPNIDVETALVEIKQLDKCNFCKSSTDNNGEVWLLPKFDLDELIIECEHIMLTCSKCASVLNLENVMSTFGKAAIGDKLGNTQLWDLANTFASNIKKQINDVDRDLLLQNAANTSVAIRILFKYV